MDLFIMRRYEGEEESKDENHHEDHLSSLLSKIEKRKKQKKSLINQQEVDTHDSSYDNAITFSNENEHKKDEDQKSIKKRKLERIKENDLNINKTTTEEVNSIVSKKKKRKKMNVDELCEDLQLNEGESQMNKFDTQNIKDPPKHFTIIDQKSFSKLSKVKRVLPYWLARPYIVSGSMKELTKTIYDIPELEQDLVKRLEKNNITHFFPVQSEIIPWLLKSQKMPIQYRPCDVCVSAPTGSGKTLAFVLPIVQILKSRVMRHVRALVVLPVQELALQVYNVFKNYCEGTDLKVLLLSHLKPFVLEQQELIKTNSMFGKYNAVDIIVTTPGRLVEHLIGTPDFSLRHLRFLVIDEADRIMESIQNDWLHHVENHIYKHNAGKQSTVTISSLEAMIPPPPQKLLFSATLTQDPEKLQKLLLFQPKLFSTIVGQRESHEEEQNTKQEIRGDFVGKYTTPAELTEKCCVINESFKPLLLFHLISKENWKNILCFTNSQENAHRLAILLRHLGKKKLEVGEMSAALEMKQRTEMFQNFLSGNFKILISTDALARGIDIPHVDYVVSYNAPKYVKTHIHRIGRTARAGKEGTAITFVTTEEVARFKKMLQIAGKEDCVEEMTVPESDLEYLENDFKESLATLQKTIQSERWNLNQKGKPNNWKAKRRKFKKV